MVLIMKPSSVVVMSGPKYLILRDRGGIERESTEVRSELFVDLNREILYSLVP